MSEKRLFIAFVAIFAFIFVGSKCNRLDYETRATRAEIRSYTTQAVELGKRIENARERANNIRGEIEESKREFELIGNKLQSESCRGTKADLDSGKYWFGAWSNRNLFISENNKIMEDDMALITALIVWFREFVVGISNYASLVLVLSVVAYILVWGLKKAFPEFWSIKLYEKSSVKVNKRADGTSEIVKVKVEKKMNTLIPMFVSIAGFLVIFVISNFNAKIASACGLAISLLSSTIDNMLNIMVNTISTIYELIKKMFGKIDKEANEPKTESDRIAEIDERLTRLTLALDRLTLPKETNSEPTSDSPKEINRV